MTVLGTGGGTAAGAAEVMVMVGGLGGGGGGGGGCHSSHGRDGSSSSGGGGGGSGVGGNPLSLTGEVMVGRAAVELATAEREAAELEAATGAASLFEATATTALAVPAGAEEEEEEEEGEDVGLWKAETDLILMESELWWAEREDQLRSSAARIGTRAAGGTAHVCGGSGGRVGSFEEAGGGEEVEVRKREFAPPMEMAEGTRLLARAEAGTLGTAVGGTAAGAAANQSAGRTTEGGVKEGFLLGKKDLTTAWLVEKAVWRTMTDLGVTVTQTGSIYDPTTLPTLCREVRLVNARVASIMLTQALERFRGGDKPTTCAGYKGVTLIKLLAPLPDISLFRVRYPTENNLRMWSDFKRGINHLTQLLRWAVKILAAEGELSEPCSSKARIWAERTLAGEWIVRAEGETPLPCAKLGSRVPREVHRQVWSPMSYIYGAIAASFTPVANRATDSLSDNNAPTVGRNQPGHATGTTSGLSGGFLLVTTPTASGDPPSGGPE